MCASTPARACVGVHRRAAGGQGVGLAGPQGAATPTIPSLPSQGPALSATDTGFGAGWLGWGRPPGGGRRGAVGWKVGLGALPSLPPGPGPLDGGPVCRRLVGRAGRGGRKEGGQEALGCLFPLFPDSFVATDRLPSSPRHLGSRRVSSQALSAALSLARRPISKLRLLGTGTPRRVGEGLRNAGRCQSVPLSARSRPAAPLGWTVGAPRGQQMGSLGPEQGPRCGVTWAWPSCSPVWGERACRGSPPPEPGFSGSESLLGRPCLGLPCPTSHLHPLPYKSRNVSLLSHSLID